MQNNHNRIIGALLSIAATLSFPVNRVKRAKDSIFKMLGSVPEGAAKCRKIYPDGAGHCPGHTMEEKHLVGSRTFTRRQRRFIKGNYALNKAVNSVAS